MNDVNFGEYFLVALVKLVTGFCQLETCGPDILVKFKVLVSALFRSD